MFWPVYVCYSLHPPVCLILSNLLPIKRLARSDDAIFCHFFCRPNFSQQLFPWQIQNSAGWLWQDRKYLYELCLGCLLAISLPGLQFPLSYCANILHNFPGCFLLLRMLLLELLFLSMTLHFPPAATVSSCFECCCLCCCFFPWRCIFLLLCCCFLLLKMLPHYPANTSADVSCCLLLFPVADNAAACFC